MRPAVFSHERVLWDWVETALQPIALQLHTSYLPVNPDGYVGTLPNGPSMARCEPATLALLQRLTKRAGLSASTLAALRRAAAAEAAEAWRPLQRQKQKQGREEADSPPSHETVLWLVEWMDRVVLHDAGRLDQGFVGHMRYLAEGTQVVLTYDTAATAAHCGTLGLNDDNLRHMHDAVLHLGVRELHARWMLRLEACRYVWNALRVFVALIVIVLRVQHPCVPWSNTLCWWCTVPRKQIAHLQLPTVTTYREAQADVDALMAEDITCDLCSALPFFSYIRCTCGSKKVACCHTDRCWVRLSSRVRRVIGKELCLHQQAYCGCELSTRELRLSVSDHDLLAAMASLWMALSPEARTEALQELAPPAPRPKAKRREEEPGQTEPSSCTHESEWELEELDGASSGSSGKCAKEVDGRDDKRPRMEQY